MKLLMYGYKSHSYKRQIYLNIRIILYETLRCMFGSEHFFECNLLNMNLYPRYIEANTLYCIFNINVPFLKQISSSDLMFIQNSDGDAFQSFRYELK